MFRYIGNKTRLLPEILSKTKEVIGDAGTVVDLMAGTGTVAAEYRKEGYHVIASDVMTYSKHHLCTELLLDKAPAFSGISSIDLPKMNRYPALISHINALSPIEGYFYREFSQDGVPNNGSNPRNYFSPSNAKKIDAIRDFINYLIESQQISSIEESVLKHTLIMAVNDVANISGTYGHYLSKLSTSSLKDIELKTITFSNMGRIDNVVLQGFAEDLAPSITADLCYIDPPYMKRQYAANYHILETIARGDFPEARGQSGLRNWWDQHSKLCTKTRSEKSFREIISNMNCDDFLISYNEDGLLSIEQLTEILSSYGDVRINKIEYSRFRSNQSTLPRKINEYLIELQKM